ICQALAELNLDVFVSEVRDVGLRIRSQAKYVREVKLHLGTPARSRGNLVAVDYRLIQYGRRPVARIPALRRDLAMDHTDAAHSLISLRGTFTRRSTRLSFLARWVCLPVFRRGRRLRLPDPHGSVGV